MWTTNGHYADWMFALVRTDPDAKPRHAGISMLLIDMRSPGITVRPIETLKGDAEFAEEFFDEVRVPKENLLGPLNQGWRIAGMVLGGERFTTGHPRYALVYLNQARQIAKATGAWGDPGFRHRLATLEIDLVAFLAYYRHAARLHGANAAPPSMAPVIKIAGGGLAQRSSELLMEAAGMAGAALEDFPLAAGPVNVASELLGDAPRLGRQRHARDQPQHHRQARARITRRIGARRAMDELLTEDQSQLRESAARLCRDVGGAKRARRLRDAGRGARCRSLGRHAPGGMAWAGGAGSARRAGPRRGRALPDRRADRPPRRHGADDRDRWRRLGAWAAPAGRARLPRSMRCSAGV